MSLFVDLTGENESSNKHLIEIDDDVEYESVAPPKKSPRICSQQVEEDLKLAKSLYEEEETLFNKSDIALAKLLQKEEAETIYGINLIAEEQCIDKPQNMSSRISKCLSGDSVNSELFLVDCDELVHISQPDRWSCGYRSCQMICSAIFKMSPNLGKAMFDKTLRVPNVSTIQRYIERAWKEDFDVEGGLHFNFSLINKTDWIGTTEIASMFRSFHLKTDIVDFEGPDAGKHVLEFVYRYFKFDFHKALNNNNNYYTDLKGGKKFPLYFQYQGHAQIIIGIQKTKRGVCNLIVQDPSVNRFKLVDVLDNYTKEANKWRFHIKRDLKWLQRHKKFQIVCVQDDQNFQQQPKIPQGVKYKSFLV